MKSVAKWDTYGWSIRFWKVTKKVLIGFSIDVYLLFQLMVWQLTVVIVFLSSNFAYFMFPLFMFMHTVWKRKVLLSNSLFIKELAYLLVYELESTRDSENSECDGSHEPFDSKD